MHSFAYPDHEKRIGEIATEMGFQYIALSSQIIPMVKIVFRGNTSCVDSYLSPSIQKYIVSFVSGFDSNLLNRVQLTFMQSDGGIVD
jgi:5-oxoprolinase (ATP-hydrolysing)